MKLSGLDFLRNCHNNLWSEMIFQNGYSVSTQLHKLQFRILKMKNLAQVYLKFQQWEVCLLMLS